MDMYYLLGLAVVVLVAIIFVVSHKSPSEDISDHLPKKNKKEKTGDLDLNKGAHGARSGGILDTDKTEQKVVVKPDALATWVDSEEYESPMKVDTTKTNVDTPSLLESTKIKPNLMKPQVLLVDDSLTVRTLLGKLLGKSGEYDVILKENGWEALSYLNGNYPTPDLIITDIQMPEMDGFELIDAIRAKDVLKQVPIIAISSVFEPEDHLELLELEKIQGFIKKQNPFDENDLLQQIRYLMNNF